MRSWFKYPMTRRLLLRAGALIGGSSVIRLVMGQGSIPTTPNTAQVAPTGAHDTHDGMITVGEVDNARNGFDPHEILTDWESGTVSRLSNGQVLREFDITARDKEIEIAPGMFFPAWTYNGRVPGPTLRATEGDRIRIRFVNGGSHTHSMHFHGIHPARMDGVPGAGDVPPGGVFVYEFDAFPFGCHLYHCHSIPLKRHIHKGLYGAFIVDPDPDRHPEQAEAARSRLLGSSENARWQEFVLVMNGFDTNFDEENEIYAVNSIAHAYFKRPIPVNRDRPLRLYLINVTEFDPVNSLHLHANFFDYYDHGTTLTPTLRTVDTVMQCQAQRGILEVSFSDHEPGFYMFHAHQSEFAELGWMSLFDVREA
ncbi:multicopper oxidase domain-containing protein [Halomonas ramblicola]|uniref:multicopper oxidase domain-containing protein n=1 Tax=Halomonas ramblicola TaxID=747349 RepID=UPI0025B55637|nr:multicopper oxidase domain-containing protein [Halomonas ramblicola]MDN3522703.1 multicopper oxidase domain-containing protein [Halomonas ramblicola]